MRTAWTKELSSLQPLEFERINDTTYIQRRNIEKAPDKGDGTDSGYICESRMISEDVYEDIQDQISSVKQIVSDIINSSTEINTK